MACNHDSYQVLTTDAKGAVSTAVKVARSFVGRANDGTVVGDVDCKVITGGCSVGVATMDMATFAAAPVTFR